MKLKCLTLFVLISSALMAALFSNTAAQSIAYEDGVKIVHNSKKEKWENNAKVKLKPLGVLGRLETEDGNYIFYRPMDIAVDREGHIYVLDAGNYRVQKYDAEGKYLMTIGRPGQGPGELSRPVSLDVDDEANTYILDVGNRRIHVFNPDATFCRDIKIENIPAKFHLLRSKDILLVNQGIVIDADVSHKKPLPLFRVVDQDGNMLGKFGEPENFKDVLLNNRGNKINFAVDENDNIFVSFRSRNRIERYGPDRKLLMRVDRPLDYSLTYKEGKVGEEYGMLSVTKMPEFPIVSTGIDIDDLGRIWVITQKRQFDENEKMSMEADVVRTQGTGAVEERKISGNTDLLKTDVYQIEIFDGEGIILKKFPLEHFADAIAVHKNRVYVLDKQRTMQLFLYELRGRFTLGQWGRLWDSGD